MTQDLIFPLAAASPRLRWSLNDPHRTKGAILSALDAAQPAPTEQSAARRFQFLATPHYLYVRTAADIPLELGPTATVLPTSASVDASGEVEIMVRLNTAQTVQHRRVPVSDERLAEWLTALFSRYGVVEQFTRFAFGVEKFSKSGDPRSPQITLGWSDFRITLSGVTQESLDALLQSGIGRARGYGMGMVMVAPKNVKENI